MLKNPYINALLASSYISGLVYGIQFVISRLPKDKPETFLIPIIMLSFLVLSVAIMGLLFFYTPLKMFLDNQIDAALVFILKTIGTFACLAVAFGLMFVFL